MVNLLLSAILKILKVLGGEHIDQLEYNLVWDMGAGNQFIIMAIKLDEGMPENANEIVKFKKDMA